MPSCQTVNILTHIECCSCLKRPLRTHLMKTISKPITAFPLCSINRLAIRSIDRYALHFRGTKTYEIQFTLYTHRRYHNKYTVHCRVEWTYVISRLTNGIYIYMCVCMCVRVCVCVCVCVCKGCKIWVMSFWRKQLVCCIV